MQITNAITIKMHNLSQIFFFSRMAYNTIYKKVWDSLGPSLALARSHITARLTVPYCSSAIGD